MARRAYHPRRSTTLLRAEVAEVPGVAKATIMAPHRWVTVTPARIVITTDSGEKHVLTLDQARTLVAVGLDEMLHLIGKRKAADDDEPAGDNPWDTAYGRNA